MNVFAVLAVIVAVFVIAAQCDVADNHERYAYKTKCLEMHGKINGWTSDCELPP